MHFGTTLHESVYMPWKDKYIDYSKLKSLLRVYPSEDEANPWTEDDENRFCDEIFNTQLEREQHVNALKQRIDSALDKLKELATVEPTDDNATPQSGETSASRLRTLQTELDEITNEIRELKKYSNTNYTGFLKIVKKHDRKRGDRYKLRPMMQLSLAQRPFNSEQGYSPLL
ncbi:vacuolar transporter chaperone 2, partial [Dactylonectria estremocensis]